MKNPIFVVKLTERPRKILGPFDFERTVSELKSGNIHWTDIAWCPEWQGPWRRLFEIQQFKAVMSELPAEEKLSKYKKICEETLRDFENVDSDKTEVSQSFAKTMTSTEISEERVPNPVAPVYLQVKGSEHGPITVEEMKSTLSSGKFKEQVYVWYRGLETWYPAQEIPGFAHLQFQGEDGTKTIRKGVSLLGVIHGRDGRMGIRHRFAATAQLIGAQGKRIPLGVCADVSNTGMQIWLESNLQFKKDEEIQLELLPLSLTGLPPMPVKVKVMWYNPADLRLGIFFLEFKGDGWNRLKVYLAKLESQIATKHMSKA